MTLTTCALFLIGFSVLHYQPDILEASYRPIRHSSLNRDSNVASEARPNKVPYTETLEYAIEALPQVFLPSDAKDSENRFSWPSTSTIGLERLVIVAHWHEGLEWLERVPTPWKIISKDNPHNPDNVNSNNHTESTAYLYFLVKYYDSLPLKMAFVHGHGMEEAQWPLGRPSPETQDFWDPIQLTSEDEGASATTVQRSASVEDIERMPIWRYHGYRAINRGPVEVSCNTQQEHDGGRIIWLGAEWIQPYTQVKRVDLDELEPPSTATLGYYELWEFLQRPWQQGGMGMHLPRIITCKCCSTFTIDQVSAHRVPREAYLRLLIWLEENGSRRQSIGNAMEYIWSVLFNQGKWLS